MRTVFISVGLLLFSISLFSQSFTNRVVASGGAFSESNSYMISYTIGETVVDNYTGQSTSFTSGFQQYWDLSVGIDELKNEFCADVYPNPFSDRIILRIERMDIKELRLEIFSATGILVYVSDIQGPFNGYVREVDLSDVAPGFYILRISAEEIPLSKSVKIIKR